MQGGDATELICDLAAAGEAKPRMVLDIGCEPRVLYLGEPTVGLDVVAKERIRTFIGGLNHRHGTTIILTTHDLADVEQLCDRLLLIDHGQVRYDGTVEDLMSRY